MAEAVAFSTPTPAPLEIVDVWSRTAPKYRRRAVLMLFVLAVLFAGLCCFTFWLRTGVYWPWRYGGYGDLMQRSFNPTGAQQVTLSHFLSSPISVQEVPIHGVIVGVLFASLCSIPILVAILYRFPFSVIFTFMVIFLSGLPWMGLTVLVGCVLASLKPFKFSFRYASALVGLIPVALYFVMASWEPAGSAAKSVQNKALLYAPWVLALLSSCVICAVVLAVAKLINYRPGGVSPVLAALFAVPIVLFHTYVGRDELDFCILETQIGPQNPTMFAAVDVGAAAHLAATRQWSRSSGESYEAIHRRLVEEGIAAGLLQLEVDRSLAVERCEEFVKQFPRSRHVPSVYYLKGQAQDQRIQRNKLLLAHRIEYRGDVPSPASTDTWETIRKEFPDDEFCVPALYKLSILEARAGRLDRAVEHLTYLLNRFDAASATTRPAAPPSGGGVTLFLRPEPTVLSIDRKLLLLQAKRLREMLLSCRSDASRSYSEIFMEGAATGNKRIHPAQLLLSLDDSDPYYAANLQTLARAFPNSRTGEYVRIRRTLLETAVSRRISQFRQLATELKGTPAGAEALYHLGEVLQEDSLMEEARTQYLELTRQYPESCWTQEAIERLSSLSMIEPTAG
jgi:outer membrane protein assembly factor BamD (BamD/ComL family)